jgi:hypothetical protein
MVEAVDQVRATGIGQPGLSARHLDDLERRVRHWAQVALENPKLVDPF